LGHGKKSESEVNGKQESGGFRKEFLLFLVVFIAIWLLSYLLTRRFPGFTDNLEALVAREVAFCLGLLRHGVTIDGSVLRLLTDHGTQKMVVITECTGLYITIIYFAIIGAYPSRPVEKALGLLIGIPSIHVLNLARMVFIALILCHKRHLFHFFHGYLWQVSLVVFMLLLVILWMTKIVRPKGAKTNGHG
jgi:archaeosortase B (VPXXXP-CTERM-specific)